MEIWKTVIYDGEVYEDYEVSSHGQVKNVKTGKTRKLQKHNNGYMFVVLCKNGKRKTSYVHRLVAYAFIENNDETKTQVNHKNEIKTDNRVENLEWCSQTYNLRYGTHDEKVSKTLSVKVRCVETGVTYDSVKQASEETKIDGSSICRCCKGKQKTCGGYTWQYV